MDPVQRRAIVILLALVLTAGSLVVGVELASRSSPTAHAQETSPLPDSLGGVATCTTDVSGYCTVSHGLGVAPGETIVTSRRPISGSSIPGMLLADMPTETTFRVRALHTNGTVLASTSISFSWHIWVTPTTTTTSTTTTTLPPTTTSTTTTTLPPTPRPFRSGLLTAIDTTAGNLPCSGPGVGHWGVVIIHWHRFNDTCGLLQIRQRNPGVKIYAYQNFGAMLAGPHNENRPTSCVTREQADVQETNHADSWYVHRVDNNQHVIYNDYSYLYASDVGAATWIEACKQHLAQLDADDVDGVFFDDVNVGAPNHGVETSTNTAEFTSLDNYAQRVVTAFRSVAAAARSRGLLVSANVGVNPWESLPRAHAIELAGTMDLYFREYWSRWNGTGANFSTSEWEPNVTLAKAVNDAGAGFAAVTKYGPGPQGAVEDARYGLASWWVARTGTRTDAWGHDFRDHYIDAWEPDLGSPLTPDRVATGANAWKRPYEHGIAVVHTAASGSATVDLGGTYRHPNGSLVTSVVLGPTTGLILTVP